MDLNHRPPGPEISVQNSHVVDSMSLTDQTTSSRLRMLHPILHPKAFKRFWFTDLDTVSSGEPASIMTKVSKSPFLCTRSSSSRMCYPDHAFSPKVELVTTGPEPGVGHGDLLLIRHPLWISA